MADSVTNPFDSPEVATIQARDGTRLRAAVYKPPGNGPFPVLFAASPYRFDNNGLPASPQFLWRETGPIDFYVGQGYAYVHLDVRGSGRSEGEFDFLGPKDQADLYDAIEWAGAQPWSTGKVGSIGQSYFCMLQWWMGIMNPPSLKCIGAHDGLNDLYRAGCYHGGIRCDFFPGYWWHQNRVINANPANGQEPCHQSRDLDQWISEHPLHDSFWKERSAFERLAEIRVPLYSSGVWSKHQLHTRGNIEGFQRAGGPRKLRMSGVPNAWAAAQEFGSADFHRQVFLPFYDHYLKGLETDYSGRPAVEFAVRGAAGMFQADTWPPAGVEYRSWKLGGEASGSVASLNDGGLSADRAVAAGSVGYDYPQPGWVNGVAGFGPKGPASGFDPVRRVLTFTSAVLEQDLQIAGPVKLVLHLSSSQPDTEVFVKLADQFPAEGAAAAAGSNPASEVVTRGWLKASHRALADGASADLAPMHAHDARELLVPGQVYRLDISLEPTAYVFKAGHRIRLEIVNGDSAITEALWTHLYRPDKRGRDTVHYGPQHASELILPVMPAR